MNKLILRKAKLVQVLDEGRLLLEDYKSGELLFVTYSAHIRQYPELKPGTVYLVVASPHDPLRGRLIYSEKGYDLDYSYL